ncbi:MAG: Na+/H+ antiporter [Acidimicrobiales bacterium]
MPTTPVALIPGFDPVTGSYLGVGLAIAVVVVASRTFARRTGVPYPVFLVVAGSAASFVPHMGNVALEPQVVFLGFLPPLVYHAGVVTSPRELRANALPIGLGALGLVLATTFVVASVAWAVAPVLGWVGAFVLGAVVAPTDAVAATSVFARLGVPPRVTTILEGESLVNDGVALALLTVGIAAVAAPTSFVGGLLEFVKVAGGGTGFGLVVGWVAARVRRPISDPASRIVVSLLVPFVAYLPADALGLSGVLATLATGLLLGERPASGIGAAGRIRMNEFWNVLVFLLESLLFVLVGLQLRHLLAAIGGYPAGEVAALAGVSVAVVVVVRLLWWLAIPTLRWRPEGRLIDTGDVPRPERLALGWSGLRGAISLAAALSVPTAVSGHQFPGRDLVVFTTFCVIVVTLVGQGTSLSPLLRRLGLAGTEQHQRQRALAERRCAEVALRVVEDLALDGQVSEGTAELLRQRYEHRLERARMLVETGERGMTEGRIALSALEQRLLATQFQVLRELQHAGEITAAVVRQVRHELDLEQARFDR